MVTQRQEEILSEFLELWPKVDRACVSYRYRRSLSSTEVSVRPAEKDKGDIAVPLTELFTKLGIADNEFDRIYEKDEHGRHAGFKAGGRQHLTNLLGKRQTHFVWMRDKKNLDFLEEGSLRPQ
jgi:hypothetical protein